MQSTQLPAPPGALGQVYGPKQHQSSEPPRPSQNHILKAPFAHFASQEVELSQERSMRGLLR